MQDIDHEHDLAPWQHSHDFGTDRSATERRAWAVVALTLAMMVAEVGAGWWWNSMALLADGWHMGTHAVAIGVAGVSYWLARRWAGDARFSLGPWKIEVLGAYTSAVLLALVAASVAVESVRRLIDPAPVSYDESLAVAAIGLVVNVVSAWLLHGGHSHSHGHGHGDGQRHAGDHAAGHGHGHGAAHAHARASGARTHHGHGHVQRYAHDPASGDDHRHGMEHARARAADTGSHDHGHDDDHHGHDHGPASASARAHAGADAHDHGSPAAAAGHATHAHDTPVAAAAGGRDLNREAAYAHVLADAATSVLAIVALAAGRFFGWTILDPLVGLLGAALIAWWARGLIRSSATILLDREMDHPLGADVRRRLESDGDAKVADLHLWRVGGDSFACAATLVADEPRSADVYRERLSGLPALAHVMLEINRCRHAPSEERP